MKKTTLIITALSLLLIAVLVISGFKGGITGGSITCNTPYLLVGTDCCLDQNDNKICDKDETTPQAEPVETPKEEPQTVVEEIKETPKEENPDLLTDEFKITLGDSVTFGGKTIKLVDVQNIPSPPRGTYDVDGAEKIVYGTKEMELINGIKITNIQYLNLENGFIVKLEKLVLGEGEYLIDMRKDITIKEVTFSLEDVAEIDDVRQITIHALGTDMESSKLVLEEGETGTYAGLKITNMYAFPSGYKLERQAIIKVI